VKKLRPTVLIGAAAISGVFTPEIIRDMARLDFFLLLLARLDLHLNDLSNDLLFTYPG
jgi:hypothetical protein